MKINERDDSMAYKVMGIVAGRKGGNTEMLMKEALLACKEQGAEVSWINLQDFKILHCTGCEGCVMNTIRGGKEPFCVWNGKDDVDAIFRAMLDKNGFVIAIPTYDLVPSALWSTLMHRSLTYEMSFLEKMGVIDKVPDRVAGLISLGGSTRSWQSMALEGLGATMFTQSITVVDMQLATRNSANGQVALRPEQFARARKLGENVMTAIKTDPKERRWLGDEGFGLCPVCHSNAVAKGEEHWDGVKFEMECVVCGAGGTIERNENGEIYFKLAEDGLCRCRVFTDKRVLHLDEIMENHKQTAMNREKVKEVMAKYRDIEIPKTLETAFPGFKK